MKIGGGVAIIAATMYIAYLSDKHDFGDLADIIIPAGVLSGFIVGYTGIKRTELQK